MYSLIFVSICFSYIYTGVKPATDYLKDSTSLTVTPHGEIVVDEVRDIHPQLLHPPFLSSHIIHSQHSQMCTVGIANTLSDWEFYF